jgi:hypothetical protein
MSNLFWKMLMKKREAEADNDSQWMEAEVSGLVCLPGDSNELN